MSQSIWEKVGAMLGGQLPASRNRQLASLGSGSGRRAHRLFRLYGSLLSELERAAGQPGTVVRALDRPGGLLVVVERPALAYRRRTLVPPPLAGFFRRRLAGLGLGEILP